MMKKLIAIAVLGACSLSSAMAQGKFPDGMLKLVVPFAAGGGVDQAARLLGKQLQTDLGVSVIVENKGGASGTIGQQAVATAAPDGYTIMIHSSSHTVSPSTFAKLPFDTEKDFAGI
eukprot:gene6275-7510_t